MEQLMKLLKELEIQVGVDWHRYTEDGAYNVYGWIQRPDGRFDFLLIQYCHPGDIAYATSSVFFSERIHEIIYGTAEGHVSCRNIKELYRELLDKSALEPQSQSSTKTVEELADFLKVRDQAFSNQFQNTEAKAENPGESDKLLAVSMLLTELREVSFNAGVGMRGRDYTRRDEERFWHLLGFTEGVVEAMQREADAPESFGSWAFYTECRLRHFRSVFVPQSASL